MTERKKRTTKQERAIAQRFRDGVALFNERDIKSPHFMKVATGLLSILRKFIVVPEDRARKERP